MKNLVCENICKSYSKKEVLENINLTIEPNKIYGLIGRNGSGKTTLMSIMTAQNTCDSGNVTYNGEKVWENQKALDEICFSREINTMTSTGNNAMKIKEYLKLASIYYPKWDNEYANRLVKDFNLDIKQKFYKVSKGMLSMVTIIIALASKSPITILDEPVAGLDVVMREKFYQLLIDEYTETGRTFIVSTHIIEEAVGVFEEIIILDQKKIIAKENTQDFLEKFRLISGHEDIICTLEPQVEVLHSEKLGRNKSICIKLKEGQSIKALTAGLDVDIEPVSLQKIFVYLTNG